MNIPTFVWVNLIIILYLHFFRKCYKLSSDWMRNVAQYCVKLQKDIAEKLHWLSAAGLEA